MALGSSPVDIILKSDFRLMHTLSLYYEHFDIRMIPCEVKNKNLRRPLEQSPEDLEKKQKKKTDSGDVPKKRVNGMVKDQF